MNTSMGTRTCTNMDLLSHQGLVELPSPAPVADGEQGERPVLLAGRVLQPRQLGVRSDDEHNDDEQRDCRRSCHGDRPIESPRPGRLRSSPWKQAR